MSTATAQVLPGLSQPVYDAQGIFRLLLKGMSEPGLIARIDDIGDHPEGMDPAAYAVALTLFDHDTRIHLMPSLQQAQIIDSLRFHTGSPFIDDLATADFVVSNENERPELDQLNAGSEEYPDQSCTLVIQCESLFKGIIYRATGPGIESSRKIRCSAFNGTLLHQREKLSRSFPLGIDLILTCGREFFCIPRTTVLVAEQN
jgi:alpha-D-ribose 1-methylphosphonate 5-triphosphate synthase subunit PhnH